MLLALLVDPFEADDMADSINSKTETAIDIEVNDRVFSAPITLKDFQSLPSKDALEKMKITLAQWVMTTEQAGVALSGLTMWDRRFDVWCACAVAREALRFVAEGELRPLRAIETAESWVRGIATAAQVESAAAAADDAAYFPYAEAAYAATAAYAAAYVAIVESAAYFAASAAVNVAEARAASAALAARAAAYSEKYRAIRDAELIRLREVVANACLTFPG